MGISVHLILYIITSHLPQCMFVMVIWRTPLV